MKNLERYETIKKSFIHELKYNDSNIIYNNDKLALIEEKIPNFINIELDKLTNKMSEFYNDVKFPNYTDFEDYASLYDKGRNNLFTKRIDDELSYSSKVLELGCGTGQLSLFLARGNREIYGVDISNGSLSLGEKFRLENLESIVILKTINE